MLHTEARRGRRIGFRRLRLDPGDESIAESRNCLDIARFFGIVGQLPAQLADGAVQHVVGHKGAVPDRIDQLAPAYQASPVLKQKNQ